MLQSRTFSLAVGWISGANGYPLNAKRLAACWRTVNIDTYINMAKDALSSGVKRVFFGESASGISICNEPKDVCFNPAYAGSTIESARLIPDSNEPQLSDDSDEDSSAATQPFPHDGQLPDYIPLSMNPSGDTRFPMSHLTNLAPVAEPAARQHHTHRKRARPTSKSITSALLVHRYVVNLTYTLATFNAADLYILTII